MNEHASETVAALKRKVVFLQTAVAVLEAEFGLSSAVGNGSELPVERKRILATGPSRTGLTDVTDRGTELIRRAVKKGRRNQQKVSPSRTGQETKKAKTRNTRPGAFVSKRDPNLISVARGLGASFVAEDLAKAAGLERKQASNVITGWLQWGWLKRVGYGQYERTKKFGAGVEHSAGEVSAESERMRREIHEEIKAGKPGED